MKRRRALDAVVASFLFLAALTVASHAEDGAVPTPAIRISGNVQTPREVTLQDLQKLPQTSVQVTFLTDRGPETGKYGGVLLWNVLGLTPFSADTRKNARLRHAILVTGRDGYAVALSVGEIDPDFEGKQVILATSKNGGPPDPSDGIRLIVPNDHHGGRAVRDVVAIAVE